MGGKSIWNHTSENAMSRDGWLQFSVMAKDCDLKHAIQLCRNWSEFSGLNLLTLWQFFPVSNWTSCATIGSCSNFNILEVGPDFTKLTDVLREWTFGFDDYYDVFILDFVPGEPHMDLYNIVVAASSPSNLEDKTDHLKGTS
jgi:hypothetical protein